MTVSNQALPWRKGHFFLEAGNTEGLQRQGVGGFPEKAQEQCESGTHNLAELNR